MRCILVNGARLKADTCCCYCLKGIGDVYLRDLLTKRVYCDHDCYAAAVGASVRVFEYRAPRPASSSGRSAL